MLVDLVVERCAITQVPAWIVKGIIGIESSNKQFALNVNYPKRNKISYVPQFNNLVKATEQANSYLEKGMTVSVGLMQVSSQNFKAFGYGLVDAFDACKNVRAGSKIFYQAWKITSVKYKNKQVALNKALSLYNSGDEFIGLPYAKRFRLHTKTTINKNKVIMAKLDPRMSNVELLNIKPKNKVYLKLNKPVAKVPTGLDFNRTKKVGGKEPPPVKLNKDQLLRKRKHLEYQRRYAEKQRQIMLGIRNNPYEYGTRIMINEEKPANKKSNNQNNVIPFTNGSTRIDLSAFKSKLKDLSTEGAEISFEPHEAEHLGAFEENAVTADDE